MSAPIALRDDYDGALLRRLAKASKDANQTRRLFSLALIYDRASCGEAASLGGVTLQIIRDWVLRFNAEGPDGLLDRKAPGGSPRKAAKSRPLLKAAMSATALNRAVATITPIPGTVTRGRLAPGVTRQTLLARFQEFLRPAGIPPPSSPSRTTSPS